MLALSVIQRLVDAVKSSPNGIETRNGIDELGHSRVIVLDAHSGCGLGHKLPADFLEIGIGCLDRITR
jgi:hypothetical protein